MSTIGHPLSDISNLLTPYFTARLDPRRSVNVHPGFLPRATRGLPTPDEITTLYFSVVSAPSPSSSSLELTLNNTTTDNNNNTDSGSSNTLTTTTTGGGGEGVDRRRELQWAQAFNIFRLAAICQGIAARQAGRQASSEQARRHGDARGPLAEFAWELVQSARSPGGGGNSPGSGSGFGSGGSDGGGGGGGNGRGRGPRL